MNATFPPKYEHTVCVMRVRASYDLSTFEFLFYFPYAPWALGSNSVVIEETCAKPFFCFDRFGNAFQFDES